MAEGLPLHLTCVGAAPVTVPVAHVATDVHPTTRTVAVYAHLESAEEARLRHGQACRARLTLTETERPVVPPASLVERDGDRATVFRFHESEAIVRAASVRLGAVSELGYPIVEGLDSGAMIVLRGATELRDGQRVRTTSRDAGCLTDPGG